MDWARARRMQILCPPLAAISVLGFQTRWVRSLANFTVVLKSFRMVNFQVNAFLFVVCIGMFMASQEKVIACGMSLTAFGMVLKFIAGPAAMAIGAIAVGLHGDVLRVAIIQVHIN